MASEERNALAELAHTLCGVVVDSRYYATIGECIDMANAIGKARLIIAELAKVGNKREGESNVDVLWRCNDCIANCRAIAAEEGVKQ